MLGMPCLDASDTDWRAKKGLESGRHFHMFFQSSPPEQPAVLQPLRPYQTAAHTVPSFVVVDFGSAKGTLIGIETVRCLDSQAKTQTT